MLHEQQTGAQLACAIHWYKTGQQTLGDQSLAAGQQLLRRQLAKERNGSARCGRCLGCCQSQKCVHAHNAVLAAMGHQGALWASEGFKLVGRTFKV